MAYHAQQHHGKPHHQRDQQPRAQINADIHGGVVQQPQIGQHIVLIALHMALALDDDILPLLVHNGLYAVARQLTCGLGGLLIDNHVGTDDRAQKRLHNILQKAGVHTIADDLHNAGHGLVFLTLSDIAGHGVLHSGVKGGIQAAQIGVGGVQQRAQLIIAQVKQRQDGAGVGKLVRSVAPVWAVILQRFAVLDDGLHLAEYLIKIAQDAFCNALYKMIGRLHGLRRRCAQGFCGYFVHHVAVGGDGVPGDHADGDVIADGHDRAAENHQHHRDAAYGDQRAHGKRRIFEALCQSPGAGKEPAHPCPGHAAGLLRAHALPPFFSYFS